MSHPTRQSLLRRLIPTALTASLLSSSVVAGGVDDSLDDFFDDLDYNTHVSSPSAYKGQSANYYSGGSLFMRSKVMDISPIQVTMPKISAGCGGIDMFMGGFSHINSDQLVAFGKSVVADSIPFGVDLALQTWAPQIKSIRDNLQSISDKFLNQSINSCETAQAGISALAGFAGVGSQKYICATMGLQNNAFSDWVEAQQGCGADGQADAQLNAAKRDDAYKDMVKKNHNIVWSTLMKNSFLASDKDLAEFFMSLSGTVIYDKDGNPTFYNGLLSENNNLVNALLTGNSGIGKHSVKVYECDNTAVDKCLNLRTRTLSISENNALQRRIEKTLESIITKLERDRILTSKEKGFLEYTDLPVLKMFMSSIAVGELPPVIPYARVIAVNLVETYLNNALFIVKQSLSGSQNDPVDLEKLERNMTEAKHFLVGLADDARSTIISRQALISNTRKIEQEIEGALSAQANNNLGFEL